MNLRDKLAQLTERVRGVLPDPAKEDGLEHIFRTYEGVFAPNFIVWMSRVHRLCGNPTARAALWGNLRCELENDHPGMLFWMCRDVDTEYDHCHRTEPFARAIDDRCYDLLDGLSILAALETTSRVFIAWMKEAAPTLGLSDTKYLDVHGEADDEHADSLVKAYEAESAGTRHDPDPALLMVFALLRAIFVPHN